MEDVNSNFVQLYLFLSTAQLSARQRELLPLLLDTWMSSPLIKDGVITDIETVVKRRSRTLLAHDYYLGFSGYSQHQLDICYLPVMFQARPSPPARTLTPS